MTGILAVPGCPDLIRTDVATASAPFLTYAGHALNEPRYIDDAVSRAVLVYDEFLDPDNVLLHHRWLSRSLQMYLATVPLDLVDLVLDRSLRSDHPGDEPFEPSGNPDLHFVGITTSRGSAAEGLGDPLLSDPDGTAPRLWLPIVRADHRSAPRVG
ncbi:hypothetical protein AB0H24_34515 [Streptomyces globisporus]|uniref:hypothetical protein n=1 Tax=Streptomyces TaxID=1883 RepID=UPI00116144A3|nr:MULTISPECIES: hypothetical protein [Streptomyces]UIZ11507.1 glycoside hydrolase family 88 protein [Streptomyces sp. R527F]